MNFRAISHFFSESSLIIYVVLAWLSFYFILFFAVLFAGLSFLANWRSKEKESLETLLLDEKDLGRTDSILRKCTDTSLSHSEIYKNLAACRSSLGLTWLSIVTSTSPFIGLFGTIISILETFGGLGTQNSLSTTAPKISEALVATGCGILVTIPAYTPHSIIKRKALELLSIIGSEIKVLGPHKG